MEPSQARTLSAVALAYLGDAVWELHVRRNLLSPPVSASQMHTRTVERVCARSQASLLIDLQPYLMAEELELVRRGRNATMTIPRHLDPATYRLASGLETLLGYLYLSAPERLISILKLCDEIYHHGPTAPPKA